MTTQTIAYDNLLTKLRDQVANRRLMVAIAGPPAAGKSTLAEQLTHDLNARSPGLAAAVPMDGFHYDDRILTARGDLARKGAPHTFDVGGLRSILERLRANTEDTIAVPLFDRDIEISRNCAMLVAQSVRIILVEGNYLLLKKQPWASLHGLFDVTVFASVPEPELLRRLHSRWDRMSAAELAIKLDGNDLPNARLILDGSIAADYWIDTSA